MSDQITSTAPADATETPSEAADTTPEYQRIPHKVNLDGQETEVDYQELVRGYQKAVVSHRKFEEAAAARRQVEEFEKSLEENPVSVLQKKLGQEKFKELAIKYLASEFELEEMDPVQRELREKEARLKEYEERERRAREEAEQKHRLSEQKAYADKLEKDFVDALGKTNLPRTTHTLRRMVEEARAAIRAGYELDSAELAQVVSNGYRQDLVDVLGNARGEELLALIPENILKEIRAADLARVQKTRPVAQKKSEFSAVNAARSARDVWSEIEKLSR